MVISESDNSPERPDDFHKKLLKLSTLEKKLNVVGVTTYCPKNAISMEDRIDFVIELIESSADLVKKSGLLKPVNFSPD